MKTTTIILSKNEFVRKDGKLYYKELGRYETTDGQPEWWNRCVGLKQAGHEDSVIAQILNKEGFKSVQGKPITVDKIRCLRSNIKKRGRNEEKR